MKMGEMPSSGGRMVSGKDHYVVAVVGATGAVGNEMVSVLEERKFPVETLRLFASERSAGETIPYKGKEVTVELLTDESFSGVDIALFSAGETVSRKFAPIAVAAGAVVIDNSPAFRMDPEVPLVVPEVNPGALSRHRGIIANPNCSTIQFVVVIKPLHDAIGVKRAVVTTFQSVSGTGKEAMDELFDQSRALLNFQEATSRVYPHQIAFNLIPQIGDFTNNGYSLEEMKIITETKKILEDNAIRITATTVRVPVFHGHSESVNIELARRISANEARAILAGAPGVVVFDDPSRQVYPMPVQVAGRDEVYVGRVREDDTVPGGMHLWIVADNIRKGAATNAVQIAEKLVKVS